MNTELVIPLFKALAEVMSKTKDEEEKVAVVHAMALIMNIKDDKGSDVIQSFHEKFFTFDGPIYGSSDRTEEIKELRDQAYRELIKT